MFALELDWDRAARSGPQATAHTLRVRLNPASPGASPILPLRLAIALDSSGSMAGAKLESAKAACRAILALLSPEDRFALATFNDTLQPLLQSLPGGDAEAGESIFQTLQPIGVTRTDLALEWLECALPDEADTLRVGLLITDGHPTGAQGRPLTQMVPLLAQATQLGARGITLHTVGLGNAADFHVGFLTDLSDRGRGAFLYADTPDTLESRLRTRLHRAQSTAVVDAELHLTALVPGLRIEGACRLRPEFLPFAAPPPTERVELALPALAGDTPTDLLLSVSVPPPAFEETAGPRDVLAVGLRTGDTLACRVAAITSTASYREAQQIDAEVEQDRLTWELNTYSTALTRTNDARRTSTLLSDIAYTARRTGRDKLAQQATAELDSLQRTGILDPHTTAGILTSTRELGGQ